MSQIFSAHPNECSPTQQAVSDINFASIITTNYDLGIVEAQLRSSRVGAFSYFTYQDAKALQAYNQSNPDLLGSCPIFYCHGCADNSRSIVITADDYETHYRHGPYRRSFEQIWGYGPLLFIGFSFGDVWLEIIMRNATLDLSLTASNPKHFALMPLSDRAQASQEYRTLLRRRFGIETIFYNPENNHQALLDFLGLLPKRPLAKPHENALEAPYTYGKHWVHETTNDVHFAPREDQYIRLNRLARDEHSKIIGITGIGGQGKTSLVGSWIDDHGGDSVRAFEGLLYWSFYNDANIGRFLSKLIEMVGTNASGVDKDRGSAGLAGVRKQLTQVDVAARAIREHRLLVVLDGLEVLQERVKDPMYGRFLNDDLREFLTRACRENHRSLLVITSRFVFRDLVPYEGDAFKHVVLPRLSEIEVGVILANMEVPDIDSSYARIASTLEGHPLATRLFVATLRALNLPNASLLLNQAFLNHPATSLDDKISRLIKFYEDACPTTQLAILGAIALFAEPVPQDVILNLAQRSLENSEDYDGVGDVDQLVEQGLVLREKVRSKEHVSCHPVLRDHFRRKALKEDSFIGHGAAGYLTDRPGEDVPRSFDGLNALCNAIEILCESSEHRFALNLFERRLLDGAVFYKVPSYHLAGRITSALLGDDSEGHQLRTITTPKVVRRIVSEHCEFLAQVGDLQSASAKFAIAEAMARRQGDSGQVLVLRRNLARLLAEVGELSKAADLVSRSNATFQPGVSASRSLVRAYVCMLQGKGEDVSQALLAMGGDIDDSIMAEPQYLAHFGIYEADIYHRFGYLQRAEVIQARVLAAIEGVDAEELSVLPLVVGAEIGLSKFNRRAERSALKAVEAARSNSCYLYLPRALNVLATVLTRNADDNAAQRCLEESIDLSGSRRLNISYIDARNIQAANNLRAAKTKSEIEFSASLAEEASNLAERIDYHWGHIGSEQILAKVFDMLDQPNQSKRHEALVESLSIGPKTFWEVPSINQAIDVKKAVEQLKGKPGITNKE